MRMVSIRLMLILLVTAALAPIVLTIAQDRGASAAAPAPTDPVAAAAARLAFIRENYTKFDYLIPMRDGVKLFTSVYIPKDVFSDNATYPMMMQRTGYSIAPYGIDKYPNNLGPSELFAREKFIFVYQDVRGRYMSEGDFITIRPQKAVKNGPKDTDESTDTYDTIDWLVKHVPGNTGKVGVWGISQPGFYATATMVDAHPALVAVSPQAPVTDYYMGDDVYHNGAFMLAHRFGFYMNFRDREDGPEPPQPSLPFDYHTPDGYDFYLRLGPLGNADEKYFKHQQPMWDMNIGHTTYDDNWQSRAIWKYLKNVKPAVMLVGGWYDTEDPQGYLRQFHFMEENTPPPVMLVAGPWNHGGFAFGDGERLGNINFASKTAAYYREHIELPFFLYYLKGKGDGKFPKAWVFQTGVNQWRKFEDWPPKDAKPTDLFLDAGGHLSWDRPAHAGFEEYLADPAKPVPYVGRIVQGILNTYMTEDQRFAAERPDVLVFETQPLDHDVSVFGPVQVDLKVSTSGTDSDFDVKVIDVFPGDYPDYNNPSPPMGPGPAGPPGGAGSLPMGGYEELIRGEPFRGKFRRSFEKPVPFVPDQPDRITFLLPDIAHTWRQGHRIMIQVQSSWFPLTDRNPQKFLEIPKAQPADFQKATERVYLGGADGSKIQWRVIE
jgi:putative CocE/NonD family hydrolase